MKIIYSVRINRVPSTPFLFFGYLLLTIKFLKPRTVAQEHFTAKRLTDITVVRRFCIYNKVKWFLLNSISPSSLILQSSLDIALLSTDKKSASCWRLKGMETLLLF